MCRDDLHVQLRRAALPAVATGQRAAGGSAAGGYDIHADGSRLLRFGVDGSLVTRRSLRTFVGARFAM